MKPDRALAWIALPLCFAVLAVGCQSRPQAERQPASPEQSVKPGINADLLKPGLNVTHHFEYPHNTLASVHRALRARGELVLVEFRRVPGQSSDWVLNHVRGGQEAFTAEIEAAGFRKVEEVDLLKQNYILRFRKVGK